MNEWGVIYNCIFFDAVVSFIFLEYSFAFIKVYGGHFFGLFGDYLSLNSCENTERFINKFYI